MGSTDGTAPDPVTERFTTDDGLSLAYHRWGDPVGPSADGGGPPPVLLHHGYVADGRLNWELPGVVAALLDAGRSVVAIDARGHGASDKPTDPDRYGEARMALDLRALADLLGLGGFDLAGYSMGAVVSLLVAADDPRVRRLVVGGIGAGAVELGGVDTRVLGGQELLDALESDEPPPAGDGLLVGAAGFRAFADAVGADRRALAAHARVVHATPIPFERITAPTLVLAGADDPLAVRPEVLADAIEGAELRVVAGDHLTCLDADLATALVAFLT